MIQLLHFLRVVFLLNDPYESPVVNSSFVNAMHTTQLLRMRRSRWYTLHHCLKTRNDRLTTHKNVDELNPIAFAALMWFAVEGSETTSLVKM